jgi:hypothetical protein
MTGQNILFILLVCVFVFLIWGRWRYDIVAFSALLIAAGAGVIPAHEVFSGFGHPAVVVIALVLIVSRGLSNSGTIELISRYLISGSRKLAAHIGIMAGFAAVLSALMNNVAALAMLMPLDIQAAVKAKRSPALSLMPLSFASILGGMITLIGTPPNIVIAEYRGRALGEPYGTLYEAAILATMLAATDAALGKAVITNESVPVHLREGLNVESGLNDGICVPILLFFIALAVSAKQDGHSTSALWLFAAELGIGLAVGFGLAMVGTTLLGWCIKTGWVNEIWMQVTVVALAITCFALAHSLYGSGYIAAFTI